ADAAHALVSAVGGAVRDDDHLETVGGIALLERASDLHLDDVRLVVGGDDHAQLGLRRQRPPQRRSPLRDERQDDRIPEVRVAHDERGEPEHDLDGHDLIITSLYTAAVASTWRPRSKRSSVRFRPAVPSPRARSGSASRVSSAPVSAGGFRGGTRNPVTPCSTTSGVPSTAVATTGRAIAAPSMAVSGIPS